MHLYLVVNWLTELLSRAPRTWGPSVPETDVGSILPELTVLQSGRTVLTQSGWTCDEEQRRLVIPRRWD